MIIVLLTSAPILMMCFEKLVFRHSENNIPAILDPHQFVYRANRSTEDAVSTAPHSTITHLENNDTVIRMFFVDFSSALDTISLIKLIGKDITLGLRKLWNWLLEFLTNRPQADRIGSLTSSILVLNTGAPQGCVLSPLLFRLYTHDCDPKHEENYAEFPEMTLPSHREEINNLAERWWENSLLLNISKTKARIVSTSMEPRWSKLAA